MEENTEIENIGIEKSNKKFILAMFFVVLALAIVFSVWVVLLHSEKEEEPISKDFVDCLSQKSILYIAEGCGACEMQISLFSEWNGYLNIVDCRSESEKCVEAGILYVPSWVIDGQMYGGFRGHRELKELSGC